MKSFVRGALCGSLCLGLALSAMPSPVRAAIIGTEQIVSGAARGDDLRTVQDFLSRNAVAAELEQYGADAADAQQRVAALSDVELRELADNIRNAPAGAGVIEIVGIVFIILLILELVGITNIFSRF